MNFLMADNTIILGHIVSKLPLGASKTTEYFVGITLINIDPLSTCLILSSTIFSLVKFRKFHNFLDLNLNE